MPAVTLRRFGVAVLASTFLFGSTLAAAQEPLAPPSLSSAVAELPSVLPDRASPVATGPASVTTAKVRLPVCRVRDDLTRYRKVREWKKTLLDTNLRLGRAYRPWDLVSVQRADIAGRGQVRKRIIADLKALAAAARRAGKPLAVRSAWRSYDYQAGLFASYVQSHGYAQALRFSARAGHSEHQLGTTIDFSVGPGVPLSTSFGNSPSGKWLAKHGWKYGFIMSYPKGKKSASCYTYEPWHWRYFGRKLAREIHESGQVPRRYLYENFETAP